MNVPKPLGIEFDFRRQIHSRAEPVHQEHSKLLNYSAWSLIGVGLAFGIATLSLTTLLIIGGVLLALVTAIVALMVHAQNQTPWWS